MDTTFLRRIEFFSGFDEYELRRVAAVMRPLQLPPHRVIFHRGDAATGCYLLLGGTVEVSYGQHRGGPGAVTFLEIGALFGEVALVDGGPRTATCAAGSGGARVAMLSRADYNRLCGTPDPLGFKLLDRITRAIVEEMQAAPRLLQRAILSR
jgi:CRP-like cAMP-binding protein